MTTFAVVRDTDVWPWHEFTLHEGLDAAKRERRRGGGELVRVGWDARSDSGALGAAVSDSHDPGEGLDVRAADRLSEKRGKR